MTKVTKDEWYARYYTAIAEGNARGAVQPRNAGLDYMLASTWADTMKRKQKQEKKAQEEDNKEWWTPKNIGLDVLTTGARWLGQAGSTLRSGTVEIGQGLQAGANLIASDYVNAPSAAESEYGTSGQASWSDFLEQSDRKGGFSGKEHMEAVGVKDNWIANAASEIFLDPVNYLWGAKPLSAGARAAAVAVESEANVIRIARTLAQKGGWLESTADDVIKASPYFDDALKVTKEAAVQILKKGPASLSRSQAKLLFNTTGGAKFMGTLTVIPMEITRFVTRPTAFGLRKLRKMPGLTQVLDHMGGKWGTSLKRIIRNGTDEEAYGAFRTLTDFAASSSRHGARVSKQSLVFMKITKKMTIGQLARVRTAIQVGDEGGLTQIESVLYKWLKVTFADYETLARKAGVEMGHQENYIPWHPSDDLYAWNDELTDWVARNPDTPMWGRGSRTVKFGGVKGRAPKASFQFSRIKSGDIFLGRAVPETNNPAELEKAINAIAREVLGDDAIDLFNVNLQEVFPRAIRSMSKVIQEAEMAQSLAATGVAVKVPFKPSAAGKAAEKIGANLVKMRTKVSKKQKIVNEISELYAAQTARVEEALRAAGDAVDNVPMWASPEEWEAAFAALDNAAGNSARNSVGLPNAPLSERALRAQATADIEAQGIGATLGWETDLRGEVKEIFITQRMNEIRNNEKIIAHAAQQKTLLFVVDSNGVTSVADDIAEEELPVVVTAIDDGAASAVLDFKGPEYRAFRDDLRRKKQGAEGIINWTKETTTKEKKEFAAEVRQAWAEKQGVKPQVVEPKRPAVTDLTYYIDGEGNTVPYESMKALREGERAGNSAVNAANEALRVEATEKALKSNRAKEVARVTKDTDPAVQDEVRKALKAKRKEWVDHHIATANRKKEPHNPTQLSEQAKATITLTDEEVAEAESRAVLTFEIDDVESLLDESNLKLTFVQERRINAIRISKERENVLRKAARVRAIEKNPITERELKEQTAQHAAQVAERDAQVKQRVDESLENLTEKEITVLTQLLRSNPNKSIDDLVDMGLIELKSMRPDTDITDHTEELLTTFRSSRDYRVEGERHIEQMEALRLQDARIANVEMQYPIPLIKDRVDELLDESFVEWQAWSDVHPDASGTTSQKKFLEIYDDKTTAEVARVKALVNTQRKNLAHRAKALADYPTTAADLEARVIRRVAALEERYRGMSIPMATTSVQGRYINTTYREESLKTFLQQVEGVKRLATKRALTQEESILHKALSTAIDGLGEDTQQWTIAMAEKNTLDTIIAGQALTPEEYFNAVSDWERIVINDIHIQSNTQSADWYGVFMESLAKKQAEKAEKKAALDAVRTVGQHPRESTTLVHTGVEGRSHPTTVQNYSVYRHNPLPDTRDPTITKRVILSADGSKRRLTDELARAANSLMPRMKRGAPDAYLYEAAEREVVQNYADNTVKMVMDANGTPPETQQAVFSLMLHGEMNKTLDDFGTRSGGTVVQDADGLLIVNFADPSYVGQEVLGGSPARKVVKHDIARESAAQEGISSQVSDKAREVAEANAKKEIAKQTRTRAAAAVHHDTATAATDRIVAVKNTRLRIAAARKARQPASKNLDNAVAATTKPPKILFDKDQRAAQAAEHVAPPTLPSVTTTEKEAIFEEQLKKAKKTKPDPKLVQKKIKDGNLVDQGEKWQIERDATEAARLQHPALPINQRDDFEYYLQLVQEGNSAAGLDVEESSGMNLTNVRNLLDAAVTDEQQNRLAAFITGLPSNDRKTFENVFSDMQNGLYTSSYSENVSLDGASIPVHNQLPVTRLDPSLNYDEQMAGVASLQRRFKDLANEDLEIVVVTPEDEVRKALKAKKDDWVDREIATASRKKESYNPTQLREQAEATITLTNKEVAEAESRAVFTFDVPKNVAHPTATPLEEIISKNNIPESALEQAERANNLYKELAETKDAIARLEEEGITDRALTQAKKVYRANVRRVRAQKQTVWYTAYVREVGQGKVNAMEHAIDDFFDAARLSRGTSTMEGKTIQGRTVFIQRPQRAWVDDALWDTATEVEAQSEAALSIMFQDVKDRGVLNPRLQRLTMEGQMSIPDAFDEAIDAAPNAIDAAQAQAVKAAVESMPRLDEEQVAILEALHQGILRNAEDATPTSKPFGFDYITPPPRATTPKISFVVDSNGVINATARAHIIANPTVVPHPVVVTAVAQDQVSAQANAVFTQAFGPDWKNTIPDAAGFVGPKVPTKSAAKIPGSVGGDFGTFDLVDSTFLKAATDPEFAAKAYIEAVKEGDEQMARALRSVLEQGEPNENAIKLLEAAANKTRKELDKLNVKEVEMYEALLALDPEEFEEIAKDAIGRGMKVLTRDPTHMTDETIVDAMDALSKIHEPGAFGKFLNEVFDPVVTYIKTLNTIYPGFHYKNVLGNTFNNWIAGVETSSYRLHSRISKATRQRVKNGGEWGDAFKRLSLHEQNIANQLFDHELGVGVYSNEFLYGADVANATSTEGFVNKLRSGRDAYRKVAKQNPIGAHGAIARGSRFLGHRGDDWGRGVMFVDTLKNGGSVDEALARIHKFHFDYADLSPLERRIKRFVPFYTWTRNNLPLQLQMMPLNPGKYNLWFSLKRAIENGEEGDMPDYFSEGLNPGIRTPFEYGGGPLYLTDQTPANDTAILGDPVGRLAGMVTPVVRVPWERITNKKMFKGMGFSDREPIVVPQIWSAIPGLMPLLSLAGRADKVDGQWVMSDRDAYTLDNFMPYLGRLRRLHPSEQKYQERIVSSIVSFWIGGWIRTDTSVEQQSRLDAEGISEAYDIINGRPTTRKIVDGKAVTTRGNSRTTSEAYKRIQRIRAGKGARVGNGPVDRQRAYADAMANLKRERDKVLTP